MMFNSKYIIITFFIIGLSFIGVQFGLAKYNNVQVFDIYNEVTGFDIDLAINKKSKELEFYTIETINSVLVFNSKGEVISKKTPINNAIYLNNIKEKELIISFISNNKLAFKSILF